jgi:predicted nucleotidyltransferase
VRAADTESYVRGWLERARLGREADARRRQLLRSRIADAVKVLARDFGVTRVVLFGSLARGTATIRSDVDLLVDGLAPARLLDATVAVERILRDARVDLVPTDLARPEVRQRAEDEGEVLLG